MFFYESEEPTMINLADDAMTIKLDYELPEYPKFEEGYRRAPRRESHMPPADKALARKTAMRYFPPAQPPRLAKEYAPARGAPRPLNGN